MARVKPACLAISGDGSTAYRVASPSSESANPMPRGVRTMLGLWIFITFVSLMWLVMVKRLDLLYHLENYPLFIMDN